MRDWLKGFPGRPAAHQQAPRIVPLTVDNAYQVRLGWYGDFTLRQLERHLEDLPGLSLMVETGEAHIVGGYWRRRPEIGAVLAISPRSYGPQLVRGLIDLYRQRAANLLVADYQVRQHMDLFVAEGFGVVETILRFERIGTEVDIPTRDVYLRAFRGGDRDLVLGIERESFPWLWWNSAPELDWYSQMPGVEMLLLFDGKEPVGYSGFTVTGRDGHLDRIAVRRGWQGKGYGAALLARSMLRMGDLGVRRVALSTQSNNRVSQSLYRRFGFRRSQWSYDIYGLWLAEPDLSQDSQGQT